MKYGFTPLFFIALFFLPVQFFKAQIVYNHADSIKGMVTPARAWWDLQHYDLRVKFNTKDSSIKGSNQITYKVLESYDQMQLDLIRPMVLDSVLLHGKKCGWKQDGNAYLVFLSEPQLPGELQQVTAYFHGKPHPAKLPPWDGGVIWSADPNGNPWTSIACQGMAASVWFPNKDHQYDEVDSLQVSITAPRELVSVSNGRLRAKTINADNTATYTWVVKNPINNYNIIPYIGKYVNFKDTINGKAGVLDLDYWVLEDNLAKARLQFVQVKTMLHCFEDWFGKYPFYEDGYKLVEAPFLGMEHQSAIAYGNKYANGYKGRDLSLTGWGLKWDFIIIHESGHEWFANSITAKDVADNWVHEGFTAYSECLYTEYLYGKQAGAEYVIGTRMAVLNDKNIIGPYNVNRDGSGDMYYKAANMLHTIRQIVNNDTLFKNMLRGINEKFWHQTVTTEEVENYLSAYLKTDLQKIFDQYLRTTQIPVIEYKIQNNVLSYRWINCVPGFNMTVKITDQKNTLTIKPTELWQTLAYKEKTLLVVPDFYLRTKILK